MSEDSDSYDFIIAGGGSAGCVLANRLSEDPNNRVCLIEAGGRDRHPLIHIPLGIYALMRHPKFNWMFETKEQPDAANRKVYIPRGKVIGGSSSINGMVYMRGHRLDYDDWAAAGNTGWSYRDVLPYFKKSENNEEFGDSPYHGKGGLLNVKHMDMYSPMVDLLFEAAEAMQFPLTEDFNGAQQEGWGKRQVTQKAGFRHSVAKAFLTPAEGRKNLTVITSALVERVTIEGRRASGVELNINGARRLLTARREVILSAGAIHTPTILLRSGIGPSDELNRHGIKIWKELPGVGRNLQDHLCAGFHLETGNTMPYGFTIGKIPWIIWQGVKYALFQEGLFANMIMHAGGFVKSDPSLDRPDLQLTLNPSHRNPAGGIAYGHGFGAYAGILRPKSRGTITLADTHVRSVPVIDPHFLEDEEDLNLLLRGFKLTRRLIDTPPFKQFNGVEVRPGSQMQSDADLKQYIRETFFTVFHPVGTCKMGNGRDAVVDARLKVHGMENLRVVDASIMPTIVGGNTNAPVIMIAEKASDIILGKAPLPPANGL